MKYHTTIRRIIVRSLFLLTTSVFLHAENPSIDFNKVHQDFEARCQIVGKELVSTIFSEPISLQQRRALEFLYAYMAYPDMVDHSEDYYKMNVDYSLRARKEISWAGAVPDREFYHFVLPPRVNNEDLDEARKVFYEELLPRVKDLSMYEAALEVNHWCHEKVTYQPSDPRTSSPLASIKTAFGRCGEESTLCVAAMRSVGIPARQVYTPRWAHTDDNHAWVEVWVDGKWHFLGACEPEPVLDLGWFNAPASRGMLMHTKVFGRYDGPEEVMSCTPCYTEINVTQNYAPVSRVEVLVVDKAKRPLSSVAVHFKLYNYGEYFTVAKKTTDSEGKTFLTAGLGDMLLWASDGSTTYGFTKCSFGKDKEVVLTLDKDERNTDSYEWHIVPPKGSNNMPKVSTEQRARNQERFAREDSIRAAYEASFSPQYMIQNLVKKGYSSSEVRTLLTMAKGNYGTIYEFLEQCDGKEQNRALALVHHIATKDLRDVTQDVLQDHLKHTPNVNSPFYEDYILSPRVSWEKLTPYKEEFQHYFSEEQRTNFYNRPSDWIKWCKDHIQLDNAWNPQQLSISPEGVMRGMVADVHSRDIFFCSGARSFGIAARIDEVTGSTQYFDGKEWIKVNFEKADESSSLKTGMLVVDYEPAPYLEDPKYYTQFTLSRIERGVPYLMGFPEDATYKSLFQKGVGLPSGSYMLSTGTRMANGSVLSKMTFFQIESEETKKEHLVMLDDAGDIKVIGSLNSEDKYYDVVEKREKSILSTTGRGYYIIGLIRSGHEPSNHTLRDLALCKDPLQKWGQKILLLFEDEADCSRFRSEDFSNIPGTIVFGIDLNQQIAREIKENMKLSSDERPIFLIADTFNRVVFAVQGYTIGLGEQLMKVIHKLE